MPSSTSATTNNKGDTSARAIAWDTSSTASLAVAPTPSTTENNTTTTKSNKEDNNSDGMNLDVFLSHDGTGIPPLEVECLLRCLDARDEYIRSNTTNNNNNRKHGVSVKELSMEYRAALCECLMMLQKKEQDSTTTTDEEGNNIELLNLTYAIFYLAEIFLLPSIASNSNISSYPTNPSGGFYDKSTALTKRLDGPPGSLTADTVRYLRLHHTSKGGESLMDNPEVITMCNSDQPEYYKGKLSISGPYEYPYWNLVLQFVITGELSKAWTLLSYHSACRYEEEEAINADTELSELGEGFAALRSLLMAAPLPGGRGDMYSDDAGLDDYLEEELLEKGEDEGINYEEDGEENDVEDPGDINTILVNGINQNAYLLWENLPRHADKLRTLRYRRDLRRCGKSDAIAGSLESPSMPELFTVNAAVSAYHKWQETLRMTAFPSNGDGGVMSVLFQRFPALGEILSILLGGSLPPSISNGLSWSEVLLLELLYNRPNISPDDIVVRAANAMSKGNGNKSPLEDIILNIMKGSSGQVLGIMFSIGGGSSGAALPATMTSLLCNLLVDAGCIASQQDSSQLDIQTELLLLAAEAIVSSFSVQEQCDVGVRTMVRLLLPHAPPKRSFSSGEVVYEPRISAMIGEVLSRRSPSSDAEARDLLNLCEHAIQIGSITIADACESLAFNRALHHKSKRNLTGEVHWLLRGMEIETCWLPTDRQRKLGFACRRQFDLLCEQSANDLISILSTAAITSFTSEGGMTEKQEHQLLTALVAAESVLEGILKDTVTSELLNGHEESNLLKDAVSIAQASAKGDTIQVADSIVHCLEERCLTEGVVSTLANPCIYMDLLHIAFSIIVKEEENGKQECSFNIHGMHILMARLTQVLSWEKEWSEAKESYMKSMKLAFCKALMRIISTAEPRAEQHKTSFGEVSLDTELELMLNPCI